MLDNKSTFSANSWDTKTTANRSVSTLNTKKSHVELVGRKEQGVNHKAVLNPQCRVISVGTWSVDQWQTSSVVNLFSGEFGQRNCRMSVANLVSGELGQRNCRSWSVSNLVSGEVGQRKEAAVKLGQW